MKRVIIELDEEFHKQLKIFCFTNGITLKDYITGCVKRDLEVKKSKHGKFGDRRVYSHNWK